MTNNKYSPQALGCNLVGAFKINIRSKFFELTFSSLRMTRHRHVREINRPVIQI